jgi:CRP-like cAMP-binding protein
MVKLVSKSGDATSAVKAGDFIYKEGDPAGGMYLVEEGGVELVRSFAGEEVRLALVEPGDFFGDASLFEGSPRETSARAASASKLLRLDGPELQELVRRDPEIALRMIRRLSRRLAAALAARLSSEVSARVETGLVPPARAKAGKTAAALAKVAKGAKARLVHASGDEFPLPASGEAVVGRADPVKGYQPDVVLSSLDAQRSLSRRHARIVREGDEFFVVEEPGVRNGTFVNGKAVKTGQPTKIVDGDEVSFGLIKTVFRVG